jgi:hypothetical protein
VKGERIPSSRVGVPVCLQGPEAAALARIVAWATPDDCTALTRLVRKARPDAFEVGKLYAEHEAGKGASQVTVDDNWTGGAGLRTARWESWSGLGLPAHRGEGQR